MMQKYGLWPQFPIQRYVLGLTSNTVPDRNGEYPQGAGSYQGLMNRNCTNPLFAASLPDGSSIDPATLCNLPVGNRTPDLVYYAHIGGVPHQLLQKDRTNPDSAQKETLTDADWQQIVGRDPLNFDYTGIDPHMIESYQPRPGLQTGPGSALDPASGYEWITDQGSEHILKVDREYACIFPLATPRDCSCGGASPCTDPEVNYGCDCPLTSGLTPEQIPPICNPNKQTEQTGAKTYPTQRELLLAMLMKGQGFVSSLCPIHVQPAADRTELTDPLFGYNPAVNGIVDRLTGVLGRQCLPEKLVSDSCGTFPCLILVTLPTNRGGEQDCTTTPGMSVPPSDILQRFQQKQHDDWIASGSPGADPSTLPTCALQELFERPAGASSDCPAPVGTFRGGSCSSAPEPGWCYVEGPAANGCPQEILFTSGQPPSGATLTLQCIEKSVAPAADAAGGG